MIVIGNFTIIVMVIDREKIKVIVIDIYNYGQVIDNIVYYLYITLLYLCYIIHINFTYATNLRNNI